MWTDMFTIAEFVDLIKCKVNFFLFKNMLQGLLCSWLLVLKMFSVTHFYFRLWKNS